MIRGSILAQPYQESIMVFDGNSDICAQIWSDLGFYLICLRHLFTSRAVTIFFSGIKTFSLCESYYLMYVHCISGMFIISDINSGYERNSSFGRRTGNSGGGNFEILKIRLNLNCFGHFCINLMD